MTGIDSGSRGETGARLGAHPLDRVIPDENAATEVISEMSVGLAVGALQGNLISAALGFAAPIAMRGFSVILSRMRQTEDEALRTAERAGLTVDELIERVTSDERLISIAQQAYSGAQTASSEEKRRLLGRFLVNAARESDVDLDEMLIHAQVLVELEPPHLLVLDLLQRSEEEDSGIERNRDTEGVHISVMSTELPSVWLYIDTVLSRLHGHNLIEDAGVATYAGLATEGESWRLTEYGRSFLNMLREPLASDS